MGTFSALLALCAGNSPVPVHSPHKGQWRGALMFSLIWAWINGWVNNREAGDLRRYRGHYDVSVMPYCTTLTTDKTLTNYQNSQRRHISFPRERALSRLFCKNNDRLPTRLDNYLHTKVQSIVFGIQEIINYEIVTLNCQVWVTSYWKYNEIVTWRYRKVTRQN